MKLRESKKHTKNRYSSEEIYEFRIQLISWYNQNGRVFPWRIKSISLYQKIVSEVLLQRTRAETVVNFFPAFIKKFPSWRALSSSSVDEIGSFIKPIGLWKRRAVSLSSLAQEMTRRNGRFPKERKEIESLPGVGQYIANAIQMFCHGRSTPLLDANMARVLERCFGPRKLADIRYDPDLQNLANIVVDCDHPEIVNWAILDLSAKVCKPSFPDHNNCPLFSICRYVRQFDRLQNME